MKYRCAKCHRLYDRDSNKAWIKSLCSAMGITTRLINVELGFRKEPHIDGYPLWSGLPPPAQRVETKLK
jgi:hypothetical protein